MIVNLPGKSFILILLALAINGVRFVHAEEDPSPEAILNAVRYSTAQSKELTLEGRLRQYETNRRFPFKMTVRGPQISFMFTAKPQHIIVLDLLDTTHRLRESKNGGPYVDVPLKDYGKDIRGTGVNYVDISMAFLYWPKPKFEGHDSVGQRLAWRLSVINPHRSGPYASMRIWVDKNTGALLRMQGFDRSGNVLKQMEVKDVMKVRGVWALKRMDLISFDPKTKRPVSRTYMEFSK